ncbi:MAG: calcium-binding protein, partial [Paracoccaceae bacterium]
GTVGALAFRATVDMAGGNVKLDVVDASWFYTSATIKLVSGILNARLLGLDALNASGTAGANHLIGNEGVNFLSGGAGDDRLSGMGGNDRLRGGANNDVVQGDAGNDLIFGDGGNDTLSGGAGADRFVFLAGSGVDRVTDFTLADADRLRIDDAVWGGGAMTAASFVAAYARDVGADVLLDFGNGNSIQLIGLQNLTGLSAAIDLI